MSSKYADKRSTTTPEELFKIPFTVKRRTDSQHKNVWTSISFGPDVGDIKLSAEVQRRQGIERVKSSTKLKVTGNIVSLQNRSLWHALVIITIVINFFIRTISVFPTDLQITRSCKYLIVGFDIIFTFDFIQSVILKSSKKLRYLLEIEHTKSTIRLIFDAVLCIPFTFTIIAICLFNPTFNDTVLWRISTISAFRIYYLPVYFKNQSNQVGTRHSMAALLVPYVFYLIIAVHITACACYRIAYWEKQNGITSWMDTVEDFQSVDLNNYRHVYYISVYYSVMIVTGLGFGDIVAITPMELLFAVFVMFLGFALTTLYFIGAVSSELSNRAARRDAFTAQVNAIKDRLNSIQFSDKAQRHVFKYYNILWNYKKGITNARKEILMLPLPLRLEIFYDINIGPLQCSILFQQLSSSFIRQISMFVHRNFYLTGELLYAENNIKDMMICVIYGNIDVLSDEDNESPILRLGFGSCVGEIAMLLPVAAKATVRAATYVEVLILYTIDFKRVLSRHPEEEQLIWDNVNERITDADNRKFYREAQEDSILYTIPKMNEKTKPLRIIKKILNERIDTNESDFEKIPNKYILGLYSSREAPGAVDSNLICLPHHSGIWIITKGSSLDFCWQTFAFIVILIFSIAFPHFIAFDRSYPTRFIVIYTVTDIVYVLDIMMLLTTTVLLKDKTLVSFKEILDYRMTTFPFYLDIFSVLPFENFSVLLVSSQTNLNIYYYLKSNRLIKAWRLWKYFNDLERDLFANVYMIRISKYILFFLLFSYWTGALFIVEACFDDHCRDTSWYIQLLNREVGQRLELQPTNNLEILAIYYGWSTVSCAGYGEIYPTDMIDGIIIWFIRFLGICFLGYCISEFSALVAVAISARTFFRENSMVIEECLKQANIDADTIKRVVKCYVLHWYYNKGVNIIQGKDMLHAATPDIEREILLTERLSTISKVPLFQVINIDFAETIALGSTMSVLPPHEYVVYRGNVTRVMYIIYQGYCQILQDEHIIKTLEPNSHFGYECMLFGYPSLTTVKTLTYCKLLSIDYTTFSKCTDKYPEHKEHLDQDVRYVVPEHKHDKKVDLAKIQPALSRRKFIRDTLNKSVINVISFCKKRNESYSKPFVDQNVSIIKFVLMPICFTPYGSVIKTWSVIRVAAVLVMGVLLPYDVIIYPYGRIVSSIVFATEIIAYIDLYISFHVGYYGKYGQLIVHPQKTAMNYLTGAFFWDLAFCIPMEQILAIFISKENLSLNTSFGWWVNILRLIRIGQMYRLHLACHYLESDVLLKPNFINIVKFTSLTIIYSCFYAAITISTSCKAELDSNDCVQIRCIKGCWYDRSLFQEHTSPSHVYLIAFYWASTELVGFGFGDLIARDTVHLILCIIIILHGQLLFGYVYAYLGSTIATAHGAIAEYQERISELFTFMDKENVNIILKNKIENHFEYQWKRTRGIQMKSILESLHTSLMEDTMQQIYEDTLRSVPLFENFETSFFRMMAKHLTCRYYPRGEVIVLRKNVIKNIFIIYHGKVQVETTKNESVLFMGTGSIFGNIRPYTKTPCMINVTVVTNLDALVIENEVFYNVLKQYPVVFYKVKNALRDKDTDFISALTNLDVASDTSFVGADELQANSVSAFSQIVESPPAWKILFHPRYMCRTAIIPGSPIFNVLGIVVMLTSYLNFITVTYHFFFQDLSRYSIYISVFVDLIFVIKFVLESQEAQVNKHGEYVTRVKNNRKRWILNKRRLFDICANFPAAYIANFVGAKFSDFRLLQILRLYYVIEFYDAQFLVLTGNKFYLKLSSLVIWFTLITHSYACLWWYIPCYGDKCMDNFWGESRGLKKGEAPTTNYIHSIYHITNLLTMTGQGDIKPGTCVDVILSLWLVLSTKYLLGTLIGDTTVVQNLYSAKQIGYEDTISRMRDHFKNNNISKYQMRKMWHYVRQLWNGNRGEQMPRLFSELPFVLKCELMYDVYGHLLNNSYIFENIDPDFIRQIAALLKHYVFYRGNYVVQRGDCDESVYFIHKGEVNVLSVHTNLTETIYEVLGETDSFGIAQGLYKGLPHFFSFRAKTEVHIVALCLEDWKHMQPFFPNIIAEIYRRAERMLF